jgi:hypothetical protein
MHPITRTEKLIASFQEMRERYRLQLLAEPENPFCQGQVSQLTDLLEELNRGLRELREEQTRLTTHPRESLPS